MNVAWPAKRQFGSLQRKHVVTAAAANVCVLRHIKHLQWLRNERFNSALTLATLRRASSRILSILSLAIVALAASTCTFSLSSAST